MATNLQAKVEPDMMSYREDDNREFGIRRGSAADLAALGSTQATGASIVKEFTNVTGADGTKGAVLPANSKGAKLYIYNSNASNALKLYPQVGGTINDGTLNVNVLVPAASYLTVYAESDTNWFIISNAVTTDTIKELTSGSGVTIDGVLIKDNALSALKETISEATTTVLTGADSGKTFFIDDGTAAADYTLPATVVGLRFKFIWAANCNNAVTITTADTTDTTGDMFYGSLLLIPATDNLNLIEYAGSDVCKLTFDDNLDNSAGGAGSWVELICYEDAKWYVTGVMNSTTDSDTDGSAIGSDVDA